MSAAVKKWKIQFLFKMNVFLSSAGNIRFFLCTIQIELFAFEWTFPRRWKTFQASKFNVIYFYLDFNFAKRFFFLSLLCD